MISHNPNQYQYAGLITELPAFWFAHVGGKDICQVNALGEVVCRWDSLPWQEISAMGLAYPQGHIIISRENGHILKNGIMLTTFDPSSACAPPRYRRRHIADSVKGTVYPWYTELVIGCVGLAVSHGSAPEAYFTIAHDPEKGLDQYVVGTKHYGRIDTPGAVDGAA